MRRRGTLLSVLLLLGALPLFSQTKQPAKPPVQQPAKPPAQQPAKPPAQQPAQQPAAQPAQPSAKQATEPGPGPIVVPPEEAKKANPVKPTASSIAAGKQRFTYDCAMCHGANGNGKGDLAVSMGLKIPDLRDPEALKSMTDGALYYVIANGKKPMPDEGSRAKPADIWNLVNYVRSLAETKVSQKSK